MASSTANLGLVLPFQSEAVSVTTQNDNLTKIDTAVNGLQDGMAILANGNTHASIASGQYVYVRNHSSLAEGLYKATTAIATNGTLSTSNLTADSSGGLNDLQNQITTLNSNLTPIIEQPSTLCDDCNNATDPTISYYCDGSTLNKPDGKWYLLRVINRSGTMKTQIATLMNTRAAEMFVRSSDNTNTFGNWVKMAPQSEIDTLNSNFKTTSILSSLTGSDVTIHNAYKIHAGNFCMVVVYFTPTKSIPALTNIISGLPRAIQTWNNAVTFLAHDVGNNSSTYRMCLRDNNTSGSIQNLDDLPNNTGIRCTFTYFSN